MPLYTKTGDKGKTSIFSGYRVSKSSKLISAIGAVDELNAYLGLVKGFSDIQKDLFVINAFLAGFDPAVLKGLKQSVEKLETEIDKMESKVPKQKNFLIYGGSLKSRRLYFARALVRRVERELVSLHSSRLTVDSLLLAYINRLSDYLFILARCINYKKNVKESFWK